MATEIMLGFIRVFSQKVSLAKALFFVHFINLQLKLEAIKKKGVIAAKDKINKLR
ncbi:hypothetical protein [Flavobacterium poyangense]|uniref:hypothetical protein n=1 Tax=Flavobacterium poyangense TaxID=2204302 RepID=UPI001423D4BA|nr:hypothetical protein [Flavobacterium sp. JXAS1]